MVRNISLLTGSSLTADNPFSRSLAELLGISPSSRVLGKFSSGEIRCEIKDSVRGKDVFIVQTFGAGQQKDEDRVNDFLIELLIMISACKTGSAERVTAVLPLFPYSRQSDARWSRAGAPLGKESESAKKEKWSFESVPVTPGIAERTRGLLDLDLADGEGMYATHDCENPGPMMVLSPVGDKSKAPPPRPGYKQWMAQSGSLVADLLTCAGADRILTCDLHESTYQGFFDIPVDNLFARGLLKRYVEYNVLPECVNNNEDVVVVSPDAGGAKRASAIADGLGLGFALIHKERRRPLDRSMATMMLVGDVKGRVCVLVDDLADTANTITRAAKLLKREGAIRVIALLTHGIFSGDAIARINASALDRVVVTNTVGQGRHCEECPKLEVLDMSPMFAEAIRRVHHGESISVLFQYD
ncbi:ribose-phosphate pyrophosphokinase 5 [Cladorrhinum sp. PSN332]|nr:ribose-phosphate pyrophosphokinase 5 [Cladorrhinum sp. PSN332]